MKAWSAPVCLSLSPCLFLSVSSSPRAYLFVLLFLYLYQSIWSPVLREILTDPLVELRDSISRQQNGTVVLENAAALER